MKGTQVLIRSKPLKNGFHIEPKLTLNKICGVYFSFKILTPKRGFTYFPPKSIFR